MIIALFLAHITLYHPVTRPNIDCPGDSILFRCSIQSNTETPNLIWRVTLLMSGSPPLSIHFNTTSPKTSRLNSFINTTLLLQESEHMESTLELVVPEVSDNNNIMTMIECLAMDFEPDLYTLHVNTSGKQAWIRNSWSSM